MIRGNELVPGCCLESTTKILFSRTSTNSTGLSHQRVAMIRYGDQTVDQILIHLWLARRTAWNTAQWEFDPFIRQLIVRTGKTPCSTTESTGRIGRKQVARGLWKLDEQRSEKINNDNLTLAWSSENKFVHITSKKRPKLMNPVRKSRLKNVSHHVK